MYKQILRLALPNIITNITVPLLGMVDLAIVGHIGDTRYIGAIAIATMIFSMIYWLFGFLRMGISGFTAQAYGVDDIDTIQAIIASVASPDLMTLEIFFSRISTTRPLSTCEYISSLHAYKHRCTVPQRCFCRYFLW